MKRHHRTTTGKKARKRLRANIRRMRKQIDALRAEIRGGSARAEAADAYRPKPPSAAMIYGSELLSVQKDVLLYPNLETGGSLYGWYSETGLPIIAIATSPGRNAKHEATRFHADEQYSLEIGRKMINHGLQHVGEWHSHHTLGLAQPSGIDCRAMKAALSGSKARRFLCGIANIVGDKVTFNLFFFSDGAGLEYTGMPLVVREGESPMRTGLAKELEMFEQKGE